MQDAPSQPGYPTHAGDAHGALQAAVERLGRAHTFGELNACRQECLRLAEELKNADARGNDMAEQLLVINKVLQQELQRAKLRADSFEKCTRWRLRFACGKVMLSGAFEKVLEHSIANACGIEPQRVVVLRSSSETGEVDITFQSENAFELISQVKRQLDDASSPLRTGSLAEFVPHLLLLSTVLPSQHCVWSPSSLAPAPAPRDQRAAATGSFHLDDDGQVRSSSPEGSDDESDVRKRPEYWGVYVSDLSEFHKCIHDELLAYCEDHRLCFDKGECTHLCKPAMDCKWADHAGIHFRTIHPHEQAPKLAANMHSVVGRYVKPQTKDAAKSWALMRHPNGLRITHFITHTWEEAFADFVSSLERALSPDDVVWVCSFALDQNADIGHLLNVELLKSPFALALRRASKQLGLASSSAVMVRIRAARLSWGGVSVSR
ncbi:unnamed protein product [Effrenium voratum]|nr:unnamed protein product [Effrenium voratum]